ncbi:MAG: hypothetical protein O2904_04945 [bacterium]|nr:hypothetical protein [bacterium]
MSVNTLTPGTDASDDQDNAVLYGESSIELNDYIPLGTSVTSIMTEARALMCNRLNTTRGMFSPRGANRLDVNDPNTIQQFTSADALGRRPFHLLFLRNRPGYIEQMVQQLFTDVRDPSSVRRITREVSKNFKEKLADLKNEQAEGADQLSENLLVMQAIMSSLYEQINAPDLEGIATNIVRSLPQGGPNDVYTNVRNQYFDQQGNSMTTAARELLDRLRRGGANPSKVILAFSAAMDSQHFDPEIDGQTSVDLRAGQQRNKPLLRLRKDVLDAPPPNMNNEIYRGLRRIAAAVEKYEKTDVNSMLFTNPVAGQGQTLGTGAEAVLRQQEKYAKTYSLAASIKEAVQNLEQYLTTQTNQNVQLPTSLQGLVIPQTIQDIQANDPVPRPEQLRNTIEAAVGFSLSGSGVYQEIIDGKEQGRTGADAVDMVLAEYAKSAVGVDDETAKSAVAYTTGRAVTSTPEMQFARKQQSKVQADQYEKRREDFDSIKKNNLDGRSVLRKFVIEPVVGPIREGIYGLAHMGRDVIDWRNTEDTYVRKIDQETALPKNEQSSLDQLTTRYFAFYYASSVLKSGDERHITLSPKIAKILTELRSAIVRRHMQNIGNVTRKKGIDRLNEEDAEQMGLNSANIENIPYDEIQDRLFAYMDSGVLEQGTMEKVQKKIDRAFYRIDFRKRQTQRRRDWRKKHLWSTESGFMNPNMYIDNVIRQPLKSVFTGNSKNKVLDNTIGLPAKALYPPAKKVGGWIGSAAKWLVS